MTEGEWQTCDDPDPMVRALPVEHCQRELRLFATACVRRVWHLLSDTCRTAVEASEEFAVGRCSVEALASACSAASEAAQENWPGGRSPDARGYAASAAVDAASVWPRTADNVLAVTSCAASAVGCAAAEADESRYDTLFKSAHSAEIVSQAIMLRNIFGFPTGPRVG